MRVMRHCRTSLLVMVAALASVSALAGTPCPPTGFGIEGGTTSDPAGAECPAVGSSTAYTTSFDATEDPISEGGKWVNGKAVGLDWNNVQTANGDAFASDFVGTPSRYNDPIAHLSKSFMTFAADQFAEGTVSRVPGYENPIDKHEVELLLRFEITANNARGYEVLWAQEGDIAVVRWNGPLGSFSSLADVAVSPAVDGDLLRAEINGSVITVYLNGTLILTTSDSTFSEGQPGVGFWPTDGATLSSYGWKDFSAGSLGTSNYAARAAGAGVIAATNFTDADYISGDKNFGLLSSNVSAGLWGYPTQRPNSWDSTTKASGDHSIRLDLLQGNGESSNGYFIDLEQYADQIGENGEVYIQWRQRFNPAMLDTLFKQADGDDAGWKQLIIASGRRSDLGDTGYPSMSDLTRYVKHCDESQIVLTEAGGSFVRYPVQYHSCGFYEGISDWVGNESSNQNKGFEGDVNSWTCQYWPTNSGNTAGCSNYVANEWMNFKVYLKLGTQGTATSSLGGGTDSGFTDSEFKLWHSREGQPLTLQHHQTGIVWRRGMEADEFGSWHDARYGHFFFTNFMTQKSPTQVHDPAYTWFDEIIISTQDIADPR